MRKLITVLVFLTLAVGATAQTEITGFVDAAHTWNPADQAGEFSLDQVEVDIFHQSSPNTSLRADLEWVKDGEEFIAQVEQGFMTWTSPCGNVLTFGKFNAPIGFEMLDAPDMFQYSHALVFDYGLPTNLTGASFARDLDHGLDVVAYAANGWDANTMAGKNVTFGGRLGYLRDEFGCGLSAISGKQEIGGEEEITLLRDETDPAIIVGAALVPGAVDALTRTVIDVDLSYAWDRWTFGGEYNQGTATVAAPGGDTDFDWMGLLAMAHADFTDRLGLTFRYDWFDDKDGWAFGAVGGEFQTMQAFTIAPTLAIAENCGALIELRMDKSDRDAFVDADGEPTDLNTTLAFEMTYSW